MEIFKAYDIRGKYSKDEINPDLAFSVGKAFARFHGKGTYVVGHDARTHSRELYEQAIRGIASEGCGVTGIGLVSTPALHYVQVDGKYHGGLMITASHNPKEYHGFKLFDATGGSISLHKGLDKIKEIVLTFGPKVREESAHPGGPVPEKDLTGSYIDFLAKQAHDIGKGLRFAIDISNGSAGRMATELFSRLGIDAVVLNAHADGNFPVHGPNPLDDESRRFVSLKVKELKADFGVILDGDGDRVLFVDEQGTVIENYFMSALFSEELLLEHKGQSIVYDLISSRTLPERIAELGGRPVISRVGYTFLYDKMVETKALFGAETSGHVYFRVTDSFYTESALYAAVLLLRILARRNEKLSSCIRPLRGRYYQAPEINREVSDPEGSMKRVEEAFAQFGIDRLDGISVDAGDFWCNVRPSNTEPLLRIRLEAKNKSAADLALVKLEGLIR